MKKKKILEVLGNILIKSELKIDIPGSKTKYTHTHTHDFAGCPGDHFREI